MPIKYEHVQVFFNKSLPHLMIGWCVFVSKQLFHVWVFLIIHFMDPFITSAHCIQALLWMLVGFYHCVLGLQILIILFSYYVCHVDLVISIFMRTQDSAKWNSKLSTSFECTVGCSWGPMPRGTWCLITVLYWESTVPTNCSCCSACL